MSRLNEKLVVTSAQRACNANHLDRFGVDSLEKLLNKYLSDRQSYFNTNVMSH